MTNSTTEARRHLLDILLDRVERAALLDNERDLLRPLVAAEMSDAARAEQAEDLLRIAHETSNQSEAERERATQRAEQAEAVLNRVWDLADEWERGLTPALPYARALRAALDGLSPTPDATPEGVVPPDTAPIFTVPCPRCSVLVDVPGDVTLTGDGVLPGHTCPTDRSTR